MNVARHRANHARAGLGERAAQIAVASSIVETNIDNIDVADDHDSPALPAAAVGGWLPNRMLPDGVRSDFQHRPIKWTRATGAISVTTKEDAKNDPAPGGGR